MKVLSFVFIAGFLTALAFGQTDSKGRYGLEFTGNNLIYSSRDKTFLYEIAHHERTRLTLPAQGYLTPESQFAVSFDYYIWNPKRFGLVLTVQNSEKKVLLELVYSSVANTDTSYLFFVENRSREVFRIPILKRDLGILQWKKFSFSFDKKNNKLSVSAGHFTGTSAVNIDLSEGIYLTFGRSVESECPAMGLRDIRISLNGNIKHCYPLDEVNGSVVHDNESNLNGHQEFGEWLAPKHFGWESYGTIAFRERENPVSVIDTVTGTISYYNHYYSGHYTPDTRHTEIREYNSTRSVWLNFGYIDRNRNKMLTVFGSPGQISEFDFGKRTWSPIKESTEKEWRYFNAGILHDSEMDEIYRFGGYGWYTTNNKFFRYVKKTKNWEEIAYQGDFIEPRMVIYTGEGPYPGSFWMFYGRGNPDGIQHKGWYEYYDLYLMDVRNRRLKKHWSLPEKGIGQIVHTTRFIMWSEDYKSIYLLAGNYELPYIDDLHIASVSEGMQRPETVGDHLKYYRSRDSIAHSGIMLSSNKKTLYASLVILRDGRMALQVMRIYLPHYTKEEFEVIKNKYASAAGGDWLLLFTPIAIGLLLTGFIWWFRSRFVVVPESHEERGSNAGNQQQNDEHKPETVQPLFETEISDNGKPMAGIYLLGDFRIINETGTEIASELKGKARELFLQMILFKYMKGKHLSYQFVHETLWSDFDDSRRNNNRKVTMSALRKSLESFPQLEVETNDHTFSVTTANLYCDLGESIRIFKKLESAEPNSALDDRAIQLLEKGILLKTSIYEWLEPFVEHYNNLALDALDILSKHTDEESSDRLLKLGQLYFEFDQFSETGLQLKIKGYMKGKKPHLAAKDYKTFCARYEKYFAEKFGGDFDVLAQNPLNFSRD